MEHDEDINTNDTSTPPPTLAVVTSPPPGPITRARARQLNHQVSSLLTSCPLYLDNVNARTFVFLRNDGEDKKGSGFAWTGFGQQHRPTCNSAHDFIRTSFGVFKYFTESL